MRLFQSHEVGGWSVSLLVEQHGEQAPSISVRLARQDGGAVVAREFDVEGSCLSIPIAGREVIVRVTGEEVTNVRGGGTIKP